MPDRGSWCGDWMRRDVKGSWKARGSADWIKKWWFLTED
jgi:hypothetical protein